MHIIDLSQPIYDQMPVYPGDPEVFVKQIHHLKSEGWNLRQMTLVTHTGTHVDAPIHMVEGGNNLSQLPLERFMGQAQLVDVNEATFPSKLGLVLVGGEVDVPLFEKIFVAQPPFICVGDGKDSSLSVEMERKLLENNIITFTDLVNLDQLPKEKVFMFYGLPLNIKDGDGSPIRAVAIIE